MINETNIMEKKIIDFGTNPYYGGYYVKYSDDTIRTLYKDQLIKMLNKEERFFPSRGGKYGRYDT